MSDWFPIESAPKDGTEIRLFVPAWRKYVKSFQIDACWHSTPYEEAEGYWEGCEYQSNLPDSGQPTHWMPLPEDPE